MRGRLRLPRPGTVLAGFAVFAALGGAAYAASKIDTDDLKRGAVTAQKLAKDAVGPKKIRDNAVRARQVKDSTLTGDEFRNNSITGQKIDEDTLGEVPRAANADTVDGKHAVCDAGTQLFAGECWENSARAAAPWLNAVQTCAAAG